MQRFPVTLLALALAFACASAQAQAQTLPATFEHGRVFVHASAPDGTQLVFQTDTGGGYNAIARSVAERHALPSRGTAQSDDGVDELVAFPPFARAAGIPPPAPERWLQGHLVVVPDAQLETDGFLGSRWFAGGIWAFDYGKQTLSRLEHLEGHEAMQSTPLGFRHDASGKRDLDFPRVAVEIDARPLDLLLDTGATAQLTGSSGVVHGLAAGTRVGASYIAHSTFEDWRARHPDWRVVEAAEAITGVAEPMIEVPSLQIAGVDVGPVWFARRPDDTFRKWMSQMTDRPVEGAIGGSAFRHVRMVLDYPAAMAWFAPLDAGGERRE